MPTRSSAAAVIGTQALLENFRSAATVSGRGAGSVTASAAPARPSNASAVPMAAAHRGAYGESIEGPPVDRNAIDPCLLADHKAKGDDSGPGVAGLPAGRRPASRGGPSRRPAGRGGEGKIRPAAALTCSAP